MKNRYYAASLLALTVLSTQLEGWGARRSQMETPPQESMSNSPFNANQAWFVKESYLIMKAHEDDIDSATRFTFIPSRITGSAKVKSFRPDFGWGSGVRFEVGRYLPHHDLWDVTLTSTYYYNDVDGHKDVNYTDNFIETLWDTDVLGAASKGSLVWRLNYFTWDLLIGRAFSLTSHLNLHPFIGARSFLIYHDYKNRFLSQFGSAVNFDVLFSERTSFKASNQIWGIGPQVGTSFDFHFKNEWSLLGSFAASFFYAYYEIKETFKGRFPALESGSNKAMLTTKDTDNVFRANLEGTIGIGWEKWVRDNTVRINPTFMFEASHWFGINNWVSLQNMTGFTVFDRRTVDVMRHYGDLDLYGFTLNLQIDF